MSSFQKEVLRIDESKRCIQSDKGRWNLPLGDCLFGVPQDEFFGWTPLDEVPEKVEGFSFYLGSNCEPLLEAFCKSAYPKYISRLSIGNSSFSLGEGKDYGKLTSILSNTHFPSLKHLELGVWQLFHNEHCMYGNLGNITQLLKNTPYLEELALYGSFDLDCQIDFKKLTKLTVTLDDYTTGINGGFITQSTLNYLLESSFPSVRKINLDLDCDENDQEYSLPNLFSSGENIPEIESIEITGGYAHHEGEKMEKRILSKKKNIKFYFEQSE